MRTLTNKNVKTILARLEEVKLGETLEDGVDLGQVGEVLDKIGVKILDTKGELRDIGTVLEEIGNKWDQLSVAQQNAIENKLGHKNIKKLGTPKALLPFVKLKNKFYNKGTKVETSKEMVYGMRVA